MAHEYEVDTSAGKVVIRTNRHHSIYDTIHQWVHAHMADISALTGVSSVGLMVYSIFHGGKRLK